MSQDREEKYERRGGGGGASKRDKNVIRVKGGNMSQANKCKLTMMLLFSVIQTIRQNGML